MQTVAPRMGRLLAITTAVALTIPSVSAEEVSSEQNTVLFTSVRIFDGNGDYLSEPSYVLIKGNKIDTISQDSIQPPLGATIIDGEGDVLTVVREALRRGASQIKISVGGGTGSEADPLDVVQFTPSEIRAAVQAAEDWGTYVTAHVYNSDGVRRAIDNGVRCIEHGQLMDEATMRYMKKKDIWLSPQVIVYTYHPRGYTEDQKRKHDEAYAGIDQMFRIAKKIGFKNIGFGSDIITDPAMLEQINDEFVLRTKWFTPAEILRQATANNGKLLAMSGLRSPYRGKIGVIEEGALADLLLIDGNPLEDISILTKYRENFLVLMKDGQIYKNTTGVH